MLAALIIVGLIALVAIGAAVRDRDRSSWKSIETKRVVVVLADAETTIEGVLWEQRGRLLVLRSARIFTGARGEGTPADGEVVVERDRIYWMQVES